MEWRSLVPELVVSDFAASLDFHVLTLGFEVNYRRENSAFAHLEREGSQIMIEGQHPRSYAMETSKVSAVLFAKDYRKVAEFFRAVFSLRMSHSDSDHAILDCDGFDLIIHQIPQHIAVSVVVSSPPQRRERGALRLNFPVQDVARSRIEADRLGGVIDERPPDWAGTDTSLYLGHDPEGNVFGAMPANKSRGEGEERP